MAPRSKVGCLDPTSLRHLFYLRKHREPAIEQVLLMIAPEPPECHLSCQCMPCSNMVLG